jgi:phosphoglycolate phosphatase-like HAD superfamily hydrolase
LRAWRKAWHCFDPVNPLPILACVVLFDIDGTLLTGPTVKPSAGVGAMNRAALALTGIDNLHRKVEFAGRTDVQIARDLLAAAGIVDPAPEAVDRLIECYVADLNEAVVARPYVLLAGVVDAIAALRARGAIVGLGTGNVRRGAHAKLTSAGIGDAFDLDWGGYGDDADSRAEVLRTGALRCDPSASLRVVIVGDTPHDVSAAHAIGAVCVGVTTGAFDEPSLRKAGADAIVSSLDHTLVGVIEGLLGTVG